MDRPISDFDTANRGAALLSFAAHHRQMVNPNASFSQICDQFAQQERLLQQSGHEANRGMNGLPDAQELQRNGSSKGGLTIE